MAIALPSDILDLEDEVEHIKMLIIGESGMGKTPFGASSDNCLILRTEKGTASAKVRGSKAKVWDCSSWLKFKKAKAWLEKAARDDDGIPFSWVTLDSVTMTQTLLLRKILAEEKRKNPDGRDLDIPQIQDHQKWQNEFKRTMQELVDLPVNLCVTALPMSIESVDDEGEVEENILPQILGQKGAIAWTVVGMFDVGGRVRLLREKGEQDKSKRFQRIYFEKNGNYWGRDRFDTFGRYADNLTLDEVSERIKKKMGA